MRMTRSTPRRGRVARLRARLRAERGFTLIFALGVLTVTALLSAAAFAAVGGDVHLTRADLDGKRAYAAAQAGLQAYLYQLNNNSASAQFWETCANDTSNGAKITVPGSNTGITYSYQPVLANGATQCLNTNPVGTLIDLSTGTLRMEFTGYSGNASRTIVASLKTLSPLSFLWYTVYETVDTVIGGSSCGRMYYATLKPPSSCYIYWVTGDVMNGPMYTQDQFLVNSGDSPQFGRLGMNDPIASQVPTSNSGQDICVNSNCSNAHIENPQPNVQNQVQLPSDNSNLLTDANTHGTVWTGTVTLTLSVNSAGHTVANGWKCPGTTSTSSCTQITNLDLTASPIIYAVNGTGCTGAYDPANVTYNTNSHGAYYGPCGDIYIQGTYSTGLTVSAANNVIVTSSILNSTDPDGQTAPTGSATLGLVADNYVRVKHTCSGNPGVTIDGAILTLAHSFFVDNYDCGGTHQGELTVQGAIAQQFRGIVGQVGGNGYLKNYSWDPRLGVILPPYLFDLQATEWTVYRESLCQGSAC